jgi:hypothetical protein
MGMAYPFSFERRTHRRGGLDPAALGAGGKQHAGRAVLTLLGTLRQSLPVLWRRFTRELGAVLSGGIAPLLGKYLVGLSGGAF